MLNAASELKYTSEIKRTLNGQIENPEEQFVRFFFCQTNPAGAKFTATIKEQFTELVKKAFQQFVNEQVSDRLQEAIEGVTKPPKATDEGPKDDIETTEEEIEGYHIVRAIVSGVVDPERVVHRDTRS